MLALLAEALTAQQFAAKSADGSWYIADSLSATVEKRSADRATVYWRQEGEPGITRALRATPDGGVARLTLGSFQSTTITAWDGAGQLKFTRHFIMNEPRMAVDSNGDFLIVGDSLRMLRLDKRGELVAQSVAPVDQVTSLGGVELTADGRLFVAGGTISTGLKVTANAAQKDHRSGWCLIPFRQPLPFPCNAGWVGRFDAKTFEIQALTYMSGVDENALNGLALDRDGRPVVTGVAKQRKLDVEPYPRTEAAVVPATGEKAGQVMTISRLSADLDTLIDSTWLAGSDEAIGVSLAFDDEGRPLIYGTTTSPNFPATPAWTRVCGPRRGLNAQFWSFGLRLSPAFDRVEGTIQFGEPVAPQFIDFDTRANCVFNGGSYDFSRELATGQLVTMIGGPFREEDIVTLNGHDAPVLYRSETQINFVLPREAGTGNEMVLQLSGEAARRLDVKATRPVWIWNILDDGTLQNRGNFQINSRRADGTLNSDTNGFVPDEDVFVYATGIDLAKTIQIFRNYYDKELGGVSARYVPGTFDSVVEFRFQNREFNGGMNILGIINGDARSGSNPGFIWVAP